LAQNKDSGGFWQKLGNALSGNGWKTDAQLKQDQSSSGRVNSPAQGEKPNTTVTIPGSKPGETTVRTYGPDGRAVTDYDNGHAHDPDPHVHDWDWSKTPPRQPRRDPTPEETAAAGGGSSGPNQQQRQAIQNATTVGVGVTGGFIILDTLLSILN
jgi:hypothetical protein